MATPYPEKTAAMDEAVRLVYGGLTQKEAAEKAGVKICSLRNRLSQEKGAGKKYVQAYADYKAGKGGYMKLAKEYGISTGSFYAFCKSGGCHIQPKRNNHEHWHDDNATVHPALRLFA